MKKCEKCGALQSDKRTLCVDCGTLLGEPMPADEQKQTEEALSEAVSDMAARTDDFHVTPRARVLGILSIIAAAVLVFFLCHIAETLKLLQTEIPDGFVVMEGGGSVTVIGTGEDGAVDQVQLILQAQKSLQTTLLWSLLGLFCFILAALFLLIPRIVWYLSTVRYRLWFDGEPSPSYLSFVAGRIVTYACLAVGGISLAAVLWRML